MPNIIIAGNATNGTSVSSDASGELVVKTGAGAGANAITIDASQNVTLAAALSVTGALSTNGVATLPTIKSSASNTPPTIQDSGGTQIGTFCRAWVNFNGSLVTNPASMTGVRASFNVSSVLDNGVGDYTINFTTAMPDANYAVSGCQGGGNNYAWRTYEDATPRTASLVRVYMVNAAFNPADPSQANFAIFR